MGLCLVRELRSHIPHNKAKKLSKIIIIIINKMLFVTPTDYSLPGFSVRRILQTRMLEWVALPFSRA